MACAIVLAPDEMRAATRERLPSGGDAARAEKILSKLRRLDAATTDFSLYVSTAGTLYPGLFAETARLREGDLKTDLRTAVFLYEAASTTRRTDETTAADCDTQLRDVYRLLCREQEGRARAHFLWAKARLHASWAAALVRRSRGASDAETLRALARMRSARATDAELGARAVYALKTLAGKVRAYPSLAAFEEGGVVANVSFAQFNADLADTLGLVDATLASLSRGPLHHSLRNARNAFRAGAAWWEKSSHGELKTVSINALTAPDPLKTIGLAASGVNYTVVCDWRHAVRALEEATEIIEKLKGAGEGAAINVR
jgi:hypothetical protein